MDLDSGEHLPTGEGANIRALARDTISDSLIVSLPSPGNFLIVILASNFHSEDSAVTIEKYYDSYYIFLPENPMEPIEIYGQSAVDAEAQSTDYFENLQSSETILLGLAMLLPPLLFALAGTAFRNSPIAETTLKTSFYTQCYYFTPLGLTFWAATYAAYFYTRDMYLGEKLLSLPWWEAILLWFIVVETLALARQREVKKWVAFLILVGCLIVIVVLLTIFGIFISNPDILRKAAVLAYPIAGILLLLGALFGQIRRLVGKRK